MIQNNKDQKQIIDFAKNYPDSFQICLGEIVKKSYEGNLKNVENVLLFVRNLPSIELAGEAFSTLHEEMKKNNYLNSYQLMMLAYRVKEFMEMRNYPKLIPAYKDLFTNLKNKFPSSVVKLISKCTIKNKHYGEYLYSGSYFREYWVYTWIPGNIDTDCYWKFETKDNAITFTLKNTYYERYLYNHPHTHTNEKRYVCSVDLDFAKKNSHNWRIIPTQDGNFEIMSNYFNEYMYNDGDKRNDKRRQVFLWIPSVVPYSVKSERLWEIDCNYD